MNQNERKLYKLLKDKGAIPDPHDRIENVYEPGHPDIEFLGMDSRVGFIELKNTSRRLPDTESYYYTLASLLKPSQTAWLAKWTFHKYTGIQRAIPHCWMIVGNKDGIEICKLVEWRELLPVFKRVAIYPKDLTDAGGSAICSLLLSHGTYKEGV